MLQMLDRLIDSADRLLGADDSAAALREFMSDGVEVLAADRAFCEVIGRPSLQHAEVRDRIALLCDAAEALTARARERGAVRGDITGTDVVLLLGGIHQTAAPLLPTQPQAWRRYLALTLDGLVATDSRPAAGTAARAPGDRRAHDALAGHAHPSLTPGPEHRPAPGNTGCRRATRACPPTGLDRTPTKERALLSSVSDALHGG